LSYFYKIKRDQLKLRTGNIVQKGYTFWMGILVKAK
jgi:hypothetical protein